MTILKHKIPLLFTFCLFLSINCFPHFAICQSNIETFFPTSSPAPLASPPTLPPPISSNVPPPTTQPNPSNPPPQPPPEPPSPPPPPSSSRKAIVTAVAVTAAGTLLVALIALFLCARCTPARRNKKTDTSGAAGGAGGGGGGGSAAFAAARTGGGSGMQALQPMEFAKFDGNVKGVIVDENGLDVLYWNKLNGSQRKSSSFNKEVYNKPSTDHRRHLNDDDQTVNLLESNPTQAKQVILQAANSLNIQTIHAPPPPPPPPPPGKKGGGPPPPPPPARKGGVASSSKPPAAPKRTPSGNIVEVCEDVGEDASEGKSDQVKMKPLHWEKVNVNADHSMVWDKIEHGSFQYNGDMMEALFGYVAANRKNTPNETVSNAENKTNPNPVVKIFMLDSKRSQNIAIIVKSLGISRRELITGLKEGKGLNLETLEKLARITPKREEKIEILGFNGDPGRLADAESFLYHLLKAIPSAFTRVNAMLFRFTYDSEMKQLKESLQILNTACTELRSRGIFLKLLEAILKAGNRLNAGTDRGDAKGFNLSALRKLSDYKSSDGKTTLLHFVVHEVVRNEGRRCVMNRNNSLTRSTSQKSSTTSHKLEESQTKEEKEKEFLKLGLPVVGGLSAEFSNVKKSATIDWDTISNTCTSLSTQISQTRQLVLQCGADGAKEFVNEMKEFLGEAEGEVEIVKEEQKKVTEFVNKTAHYYHVGGFKDKQPLQLFIIVKDFSSMVDQACIEIARSLQQRKPSVAISSSSSSSPPSPPTPDVLRTRVTFPRLPTHFLSDKSNSSDSDDDH